MKTTKKLLALVLALALVVTAFAACSGGTTTESSKTESSKTESSKTEESKTEESKTESSETNTDDGTVHPMRYVQPGTLCADYETVSRLSTKS